jgi:hypothetical protein
MIKLIIQYFTCLILILLLCNSTMNAQFKKAAYHENAITPITKLGTLMGTIKNESSVPLNFNCLEQGLCLSLHEIFTYPTTDKNRLYTYDMGKELKGYNVKITKVNAKLYNYVVYDVPLHTKFLIRIKSDNLDSATTKSSLTTLTYTGAITYILQQGFNEAKYMELVNTLNVSGETIYKNILITNNTVSANKSSIYFKK